MRPALRRAPNGGSKVEAGRSGINMSIAVELPRDRASVPMVRHLAALSLAELGVVDEIVDDVEIALSEVCTNVIDHADFCDSYQVQISVRDDDCQIRVIDSGQGFVETPELNSGSKIEFERGRGLAIVRAVMDQVGLESRPDQGTLVTLGKHLEFAGGVEHF
ncbi:MAG TPA: ATP-binding protein [Acidimicrobiales bacterium]|nr:ATP-binding protein [Acidimicrobiales bacterium]